jgi:hypothetical protein
MPRGSRDEDLPKILGSVLEVEFYPISLPKDSALSLSSNSYEGSDAGDKPDRLRLPRSSRLTEKEVQEGAGGHREPFFRPPILGVGRAALWGDLWGVPTMIFRDRKTKILAPSSPEKDDPNIAAAMAAA